MSAVISECGRYRYRLDRRVERGAIGMPVFAYFGVNGSTADAEQDDQTVRKWNGFTLKNNGWRYIVGNAFAYRATDVKELAKADDPIGPENDDYLWQIIQEADILVPCWGSRMKLPFHLRARLYRVRDLIFSAGKPVRIFGLTKHGDPLHPLMLSYDTQLIEWDGEI